MEQPRKSRTFRLSEIPDSWSRSALDQVLSQHGVTPLSAKYSLQPSVRGGGRSTAIVSLDQTTKAIQNAVKNPLLNSVLEGDGYRIIVDQHFLGLTVVASPSNGKPVAELIAVHGLSGHAVGSWTYVDPDSNRGTMWLQDLLSEDISNLRILVYGYESRLDSSTSMSRLLDYRRSFLLQLRNYRNHNPDIPLILFGHSFGGTLITYMLQSAKLDMEDRAMSKLLEKTRSIFFFGVPHKGLRTTEIKQMTIERTENSKTKLLSDLEKDSESLRSVAETLATLSLNITVVTIYEEQQTLSVEKGSKPGSWTSTGPPQTMVLESSAVLYLPKEKRIPSLADHRGIIKFSYRDHVYDSILHELMEVLLTVDEPTAKTKFSTTREQEKTIDRFVGSKRSTFPNPGSSTYKGLAGPTWALLPISDLPSGTVRTRLLGSIVRDYEYPDRDSIPEDAGTVLKKEWLSNPTHVSNFKSAVVNATTQQARERLKDLLTVLFGRDLNDENDLSSTSIRTYKLSQETKAFELLKTKFRPELTHMISNLPTRNKGAIFHVVALKTCVDSKALDPVLDSGEQIFAVQYRLIRRRRDWRQIVRPRLPPDLESTDYFIPSSPATWGPDVVATDAEDELEDDFEEEDGDLQDDDFELGELQHTWSLWRSFSESEDPKEMAVMSRL